MSPRPIVVQTINASRCSRSGFILTHGWNSVFPGTYIPQEASGEVDLGTRQMLELSSGHRMAHRTRDRTQTSMALTNHFDLRIRFLKLNPRIGDGLLFFLIRRIPEKRMLAGQQSLD